MRKIWIVVRGIYRILRRGSEDLEIFAKGKSGEESATLLGVPFIICDCSPTKSRLVVSGATSGRPQALPAADIVLCGQLDLAVCLCALREEAQRMPKYSLS